jgi:ribosomal protein L13
VRVTGRKRDDKIYFRPSTQPKTLLFPPDFGNFTTLFNTLSLLPLY